MFVVMGIVRRRRAGRRLLTYSLALFACFITVLRNASAETVNHNSIQLDVHGKIPEHCNMGSVGSMAFGDLTANTSERVANVGFNCNIPFQINIRSANGGLANEAYPHGQGPYSGLVPYSIAVSIPVRRPSADIMSGSFTSTALMAGANLTSGGGIALDGMRLAVSLTPPTGEAGLLGGRYSETVTITVSPI